MREQRCTHPPLDCIHGGRGGGYLGGQVGSDEAKNRWLEEKVET